ncbi:hypothetical protein DACRYDRAFT_15972 [Dacryopinax primogenitus]|uniref:Uncharacterized protein n=1 Tax=Dacryopinax primogenitus (strain DJM 731) TaxID=1858805 RepID=M5FZT6_DACPD|nr:uncharacterized protein DACRYDRAFT_15972 [Dacryopinax primogenitus]EJU02024.1 hypothetical protein DACRYDRAFT_15972 [Dacryopinax primogenitus]
MVDKKRIQRSSTAKVRAKRQAKTELSVQIFPNWAQQGSTSGGPPPILTPLFIPPRLTPSVAPPPPVQGSITTPVREYFRNETYPLPGSVSYIRGRQVPPSFYPDLLAALQREVRTHMPQYSPATWQECAESMALTMSKGDPSARDYRCEMCAMLVLGVDGNRRCRARFDKTDEVVETDLDYDMYILRPALDCPIDAFGTPAGDPPRILYPSPPLPPPNVTVLQTYWIRTEEEPQDKLFLLYEIGAGRGLRKGWMDEPVWV